MIFSFYCLLASFLFVLLLKLVSLLLAERTVVNREELSPYECGFEHHSVSRIPISLRYFFLTLLFLLFDLEVIFLLYLPYSVFSSQYAFAFFFAVLFVIFLYLSLIYEWNDGTLEWVI